MDEQLRKIKEDEIVGKFRVILAANNTFLSRRGFGKILQDCSHFDIDYVPLLRKAINMPIVGKSEADSLPDVHVPMFEERPPNGMKQCQKCYKRFEKGENAWKGWKRFCKEACDITDLV